MLLQAELLWRLIFFRTPDKSLHTRHLHGLFDSRLFFDVANLALLLASRTMALGATRRLAWTPPV